MERLTGLDAGFLYMETPTLHMHTLKVAILEPAPGEALTFAEICDEIEHRLVLLPPFRRRLVEVPLRFHHPVWVEDPDFDLRNHIRRIELPSPGTHRQLDDAIGVLAGEPLDRRRPLWQLYVFEGLADGRIAVLVKLHHAVADGMAATALLANVMSFSSTAHDVETASLPIDDWRPEPLPSRSRLLIDAFVDHLRQLGHLPVLLRRTLRNLMSVLRHRRRSIVSTPVPILSTPRTAFNSALTARRSFATAQLSLADARRVKSAFDVTLNDVVLATVSGALRAYLLGRGELPDRALVAGVPVGTDPAAPAGSTGVDARLSGNRVSNLFTSLATDLADPVERLRAIHSVTAEAKTLQRLLGVDTFASWVQYTPPGPYSWFMQQYSRRRIADRHPPPINLVVSNVPGPSEPLYVAGARLDELSSVGPILEGIGLNVTVWSYVDRLSVGVLGCRDTLSDPAAIADAMPRALAELLTAAGERPVVPSTA